MESECLMTQLSLCTAQGNKLEYDHKGEQVRVTTQEPGEPENDGQPSSWLAEARRTGGDYNPMPRMLVEETGRDLSRRIAFEQMPVRKNPKR